jgi:hypothetical protein
MIKYFPYLPSCFYCVAFLMKLLSCASYRFACWSLLWLYDSHVS